MQTLLKQLWDDFRSANPQVRIREAAGRLYVTEAQLVATACGTTATRLEPRWVELMPAIAGLGEVMALTRNEYAVHEVTDHYRIAEINADYAEVRGDSLQLRLNFKHWYIAFAVEEATPHGARHSLQFFDVYGEAAHKIYLTQQSCPAAYPALIENFRSPDQSDVQSVLAHFHLAQTHDSAKASADVRNYWLQPKALRNCFELSIDAAYCRVYTSRYQALSLLSSDYSRRVANGVWRNFLYTLAYMHLRISIRVVNPGATQCHDDIIQKLMQTSPWINILNDTFNLHLQEQAIADSWVVKQPTADGTVTSLEAYDAQGGVVLILYSLNADSECDNLSWRDLMQSLPDTVIANDMVKG